MTSDGVNSLDCILCGAAMIAMPCKARCPRCGYQEDCTDLFRADGRAGRPAGPVSCDAGNRQQTLFPMEPEASPGRASRAPRPRRIRRHPPSSPPTGWLFTDLN